MPIEIEGLDELTVRLEQSGEKAVRGVFHQMRLMAEEMAELARQMAPIDKGNLEDAIMVTDSGGGRNDLGQFVRKSVDVFVDGDHPAQGTHTVGEYAMDMHENLTPYGDLKLGPLSQAKQAGSPVIVGGGFIERAVEQIFEREGDKLGEACDAALSD